MVLHTHALSQSRSERYEAPPAIFREFLQGEAAKVKSCEQEQVELKAGDLAQVAKVEATADPGCWLWSRRLNSPVLASGIKLGGSQIGRAP